MPLAYPHNRPIHGQLVDGPHTAALENYWLGLHAAAVGSGTAALRLALLALGVGPGDEVIVPAYSCVALLNAPLSIGAVPVLADVKPDDWTLDPDSAADRRTDKTQAIIAVNLFGAHADTDSIFQKTAIYIIEDCSHSRIAHRTAIAIASLYATKLIGAGMGGIALSVIPSHIETIRRRRDYGDQPPSGQNLNDKITEHTARLAIQELDRLPDNLARRAELAHTYAELLAQTGLERRVMPPTAAEGHSWYRYTCLLHPDYTAANIAAKMQALGVWAQRPVWDLRSTKPWVASTSLGHPDLPVASIAFDRLISLPMYETLTETDQERIIQTLDEATK